MGCITTAHVGMTFVFFVEKSAIPLGNLFRPFSIQHQSSRNYFTPAAEGECQSGVTEDDWRN
jgi:hypothetical protein